jgi:Transposase DDE domain
MQMARKTSKPTTAKCTLPIYMGFLMSEAKSNSCTQLGEIAKISHDSVNRFLEREKYEPKDLFDESIKLINPKGGVLSVDDTVLDKPYSNYMAYVGFYYSGKHHAAVKGINLITLYYTDVDGKNFPVNYRLYDKSENKTKNDYFQEMINEVISWGLLPSMVTGDNWYSYTGNLKLIRNHQLGLMFAIKGNRLVAIEKGKYQQVSSLEISEDGLSAWLKDFGNVKIFRTNLKDQVRHYIVLVPDVENQEKFSHSQFKKIHDQHWKIEQYHRMIKQVCHIESFQVRGRQKIMNHIFAALCSYVHLQKMSIENLFENAYQWKRELYHQVTASFIKDFCIGLDYLKPKMQNTVNA